MTHSPIIAHRARQLDALRAFAVVAVIFCHTTPSRYIGQLDITEVGSYAVYGFFVLSGYLITTLLMEAKAVWQGSGAPMLAPIGRFYGRRALRLYPVYYLTLAGALLLGVPTIREEAPFHLFQVSNWVVWNENTSHYAEHFWSLAIEAQFYLVLPWLVFLLSRRGLIAAYAVMFVLSAMSWAPPVWPIGALPQRFLDSCTLQSLDSLAIGGLLAIADASGARALRRLPRLIAPLAGLVLVTFVPMIFAWGQFSVLGEMINHELMNLCFACIVYTAARGFTGAAGAVLDWKPLWAIGLISYGIYVIHPFVIWGWTVVNRRLTGSEEEIWGWPLFFGTFAVTIVAAWLSWRFIEGPLARVRGRLRGFGSVRQAQEAEGSIAAERPRELVA